MRAITCASAPQPVCLQLLRNAYAVVLSEFCHMLVTCGDVVLVRAQWALTAASATVMPGRPLAQIQED